jgi:hypothetical protein
LPNAPAKPDMPELVELITMSIVWITDRYDGAFDVDVPHAPGSFRMRAQVPRAAFEQLAAVYTSNGLVIREDMYEIIRPFVDPDFFEFREIGHD